MARSLNRLSAKAVERVREPGRYPDGGGLYLVVSGPAARSWFFRYERAGRQQGMGLGSAQDVSLADARAKAADLRKLLAAGEDPNEVRRAAEQARAAAAANALTFQQCAEAYIRAHAPSWRNAKHAAQWSATLATYVYPSIGALPVAAIDTPAVLKIIEPLWATKTETASRVRGRIEAVLDYATAIHRRFGPNPAAWRGNLAKLLPARNRVSQVEHHPALPFADVPTFMADLRSRPGISASALEFTILTASRSGETRGLRWQEIDFATSTWTVPPSRMKARKEHRVPLSLRAVAILEALSPSVDTVEADALVFPGAKRATRLSDMSLTAVLRRMARDSITVHGFRSTFRDWCAERTSYPREIAEAALAHTIGNKVEAAYRRGDALEKRRRLMEAWSTYCASRPADGENIITLRIQKIARMTGQSGAA